MAEYCMHETYAATRETPAEHCEEEALEGADFCEYHGGEADPDDARELAYEYAAGL